MQWHLRRLAHSTDKQQDADNTDYVPLRTGENTHRLLRHLRRFGKHLVIIQATGIHNDSRYPQDETEVANTVD